MSTNYIPPDEEYGLYIPKDDSAIRAKLSKRIRPNSEAAPWVVEAVERLEKTLEDLAELVEERIEARRQPKPDGWARHWTKRAKELLERVKQEGL